VRLNGRNRVSEATRQRVLEAARVRGYRANPAARALLTGSTQLVSLWMSYPHTPYYGRILHALKQEIRSSRYETIITDPREWNDAQQASDSAARWMVDGAIVCDNSALFEKYLRDTGRALPAVHLSSLIQKEMDYVYIDQSSGIAEAVGHLAQTGCHRIAFVSTTEMALADEPRWQSYQKTMTTLNRETERILVPDMTRAAARTGIVTYISGSGLPDGLVCGNDDLAIGVFRGLRDLGLRVPDDVSLVGCDGIEDTEYLDPTLTTIVHPIEDVCRAAWDFLCQRMQNPTLPQQRLHLPARLELRGSTRSPGSE